MDLIELAKQIGLEPKRIASTKGGEYSSICPDCGGSDRFRIWPNQQTKNCVGTYWCRKCDKKGDSIQFCIDFLGMTFKDAVVKVGASIQTRLHLPQVERSYAAPCLESPNEKWSQKALDFVLWASRKICVYQDIIQRLERRGLPKEAVEHYKIGYSNKDFWIDPSAFGIESDKKIFLPEGIVIPSIEPSGQVVRLKIRRTKWKEGDEWPKYWAVRGSMNGLNIVGDVRKPIMVVVESELDAYALHFSSKDLLFAVSVGSNTKNPDNVVDYWAKRRRLLICHDNDEGGLVMNEKWKKLYPHSESWPIPVEFGKDVGEAIGNGLDLSRWIKEAFQHAEKERPS